jgi:hypothetical protein
MEHKAKIFARWVLAIHLALLVVVIAMVYVAAREVHVRARAQAMTAAANGQELLAEQTADGIETFYNSIGNNLDLIHRADNDETATAATQAAATQPIVPSLPSPVPLPPPLRLLADVNASNNRGERAVTLAIGRLLWRQLATRASLLFAVDIERLKPTQPGKNQQAVRAIGPTGPKWHAEAEDVALYLYDWLKQIDRPSVSGFQEIAKLGDGNVVCVPTPATKPGDREHRLLVAFVPIKTIRDQFLDKLNPKDSSTAATLVDENMVTMVSSDPTLVGINVQKAEDPKLRQLVESVQAAGRAVTMNIERPYQMGAITRQPRMMTMVPITVLDKRWLLMISSRLSTVDDVVNRLFSRALYWAVFVVIAMTAILVSTSVWLIRGRQRLERVRHEMLTKELTQAREIQKAWLPQQTLSTPQVDLSAVNQPTSHISGDFYNWFELPDGRLVVTIGDVTGHGMSAAFLMATSQLLVRTTMMRVGDPGICLEEVNRQLCTQIFVGQFVTMLIAVVDLKDGELHVATAGHYPPMLGENGSYRPLEIEPQIVLGVDPNAEYPTEQSPLPPGASLVLYTDGVIDVEGPEGKRFGKQGIREAAAGEHESAQALIDAILARVNAFRAGRDLPDDLTLVALQLVQTPTATRAVEAAV